MVPLFLDSHWWTGKAEAKDALIECGSVVGPMLMPTFDDASQRQHRQKIMEVWAGVKYDRCVERLTALLESHDDFWARQDLKRNWWNSSVDSELSKMRRQVYGEVFYAVLSLGKLNDARARPAIERTLNRWSAINFSNPQIKEACQRALAKM